MSCVYERLKWLLQIPFGAAVLAACQVAHAHGIAGNRYFPGTLSFDDPAVADELVLQPSAPDTQIGPNGRFTDSTFNVSFARLLTSRLAIGADTSWTHRDQPLYPKQQGFGSTSLTLKGLVYENDPQELLLSAGLGWRIGGSGSPGVDGGQPTALKPGLFWGKGFGSLPDSLSWLRPFGIAGAAELDIPTRKRWFAPEFDIETGRMQPSERHLGNVLHWGVALEYSTLYLTPRFTGGPATEEPLNQLVPLVEFYFDTPVEHGGGYTTGFVSPGISYVGQVYQLALEVSVPVNRDSGRDLIVRGQLLLFLDDWLPALFTHPIFAR